MLRSRTMSACPDYHAAEPPQRPGEDWRQLLAQAATPSQRTDAIQAAMAMRATLREIEEYLDYLDAAE